MSNKKIFFIIPKENRENLSNLHVRLLENFPVGCETNKLEYDRNVGVLIFEASKNANPKMIEILSRGLRKANAKLANESFIVESLSKITNQKVLLKESNEGEKNLAVESLKNVSDGLDMLKQNIEIAQDKIRDLPEQDVNITKLRGLGSIIDSSITDVSEMIAQLTGFQTKEDYVTDIEDDNLQEGELMEDDIPKGVNMSIDDATKNIDDVEKIIDKNVNVIIDDADKF